MQSMIDTLELFLTHAVELATILMELFGVCILVITAVKCFFMWIKDDDSIRLELAQGIALALEFKMGGEVLRTVIVREWAELGILGAIIVLRGVLTFIIHWEISNEKKEIEASHHLAADLSSKTIPVPAPAAPAGPDPSPVTQAVPDPAPSDATDPISPSGPKAGA